VTEARPAVPPASVPPAGAGLASPTPALAPIRPSSHLRYLDDGRIGSLRAATLSLLEDVGFHCPSDLALGIYADHGAIVDRAARIVRLPAALVETAMARAPRFYTMGARSAAHDVVLDGTALFVATDGCGVVTIDPSTRERRASTKADVGDAARLADALPAVGFYWPMVSAQDHPATAPLHEIDASYRNTVKHVQTETVMGARTARYAVEMARVIAGDEATLRARPPLSSLVCTIAPLAQDADGLEAALVFAQAGIPVGFMSMACAGSTGPATIAGTIVQGDAEIVAALTLLQLAYPGAPVYHSLMTGVMHPRTGAHLCTSRAGESAYVAGVEIAHAWGVPTLAGVFGTDAPEPGWQAAEAAAVALTLCALAGAETGSGMGLLDACTAWYPEALVLDADLHDRVRADLAAFDTSPDALALDTIRAVGPRGHFLDQRHTRDGMRRLELSRLTEQPAPSGGMRDPVEVARAEAERILANHRPEPLGDAESREIARILLAADAEIGAGPGAHGGRG
jgi:trimethylamine--corrinoid protein Co-methyltransferase